jgi:hypothetical protein
MMGRRFAAIVAALVVAATLGTTVAGATAPSWKIQSTPNPSGCCSGAYRSHLSGVSCTAATACTAVGPYSNSSGTGLTLAERWNGSTWKIQPTPNPAGATSSLLSGVSCTAATACTAVGDYINSSGKYLTLSERWNGSSWAIQLTANPSGAPISVLSGVSCTAATACTAVGDYVNSSGTYMPLAERWNGSSWAIQTPGPPIGARASYLSGVSCTAATACTAVGYYFPSSGPAQVLAERWNGSGWAMQSPPNPAGSGGNVLSGVTCTAATICTAVGENYSLSVTLAERWNGSSWAIQPTPNPAGATGSGLFGVSCRAATACTAVGHYTNSSGTYLTLAERWNGSSWVIQATPNPAGAKYSVLSGVSCTAATACTAVGDYYNSSGTDLTLAERYS